MTVNNEAPIASARFTGIPRSQEYLDSLADLLARGDGDSVPSGILHCAPMTLFSMDRLDGKQSFALTQGQWEQHYHDLRAGLSRVQSRRHAPRAFGTEGEGRGRGGGGHRADRRVQPRAPLSHQAAGGRGRYCSAPRSRHRHSRRPRRSARRARGVCRFALVPDRFDSLQPLPSRLYGLQQRFVLDPEFYLTNRGRGPIACGLTLATGRGSGRYLPVSRSL